MVAELHNRGFEKLRIIPSLSPSGLHWRCSFIAGAEDIPLNASNWLSGYEDEHSHAEVQPTTEEMADVFMKDNVEFLGRCKGEDREYIDWYSAMLTQLNREELPYAFSDYFSATDFWTTSAGNEIPTLPNEKKP
jgi:hypothetical protein